VSTATLAHKAKLAPTAAAPEPIHPCRGALAKLLNEHAAITAGIEELDNQLSRAELDLNHAIENDSDEDIERFQGRVSVYGVKLSARRLALTKLVSSLSPAIYAASSEYSTLLLDERNRRIAILSERIAKVLGADAQRMIEGRYLDDVLDQSKQIQDIDHLRFSFSLVGESDEATLSIARHLLIVTKRFYRQRRSKYDTARLQI
jgi:hypothetical protein